VQYKSLLLILSQDIVNDIPRRILKNIVSNCVTASDIGISYSYVISQRKTADVKETRQGEKKKFKLVLCINSEKQSSYMYKAKNISSL